MLVAFEICNLAQNLSLMGDENQCYILMILNYLTINSSKLSKKALKYFHLYLLTLLERAHLMEPSVRSQLICLWTNITCRVSIDQVSSLILQTNFLDSVTNLLKYSLAYNLSDCSCQLLYLIQNLFATSKPICQTLL